MRSTISLRRMLILVAVFVVLLSAWLKWPRLHFGGAYRYLDTDTGVPDHDSYHYLSFRENGEFFYTTTGNSDAGDVFKKLSPESPIWLGKFAGKFQLDGNSIAFETGGGAVSWQGRLHSNKLVGRWCNNNTNAIQEFEMKFYPSQNAPRSSIYLWPPW